MARSSYHTLARYDDGSRVCRARCTSDIRQSQRESLCLTRLRQKCFKTLKNRKTFINEFNTVASDCFDWVDGPQSGNSGCSFGSQDCLDGWNNPSYGFVFRSGAISPSCSVNSESQSSYSESNDYQEESSFDPVEKFLDHVSIERKNLAKSRRLKLQERKRYQMESYGSTQVAVQYCEVRQSIVESQHTPGAVDKKVGEEWKALANAMRSQDSQLALEAIEFVRQLIVHRLISPETVWFVLRDGLIFTIGAILSDINPNLSQAIELLDTIVRLEERAIPFLVELLSNTNILGAFRNIYSMGSHLDADAITELYFYCFQSMASQLQRGKVLEPYIPPVLKIGDRLDAQRVLDSYSPESTLRRLLDSNFIEPLLTRLRTLFDITSQDIMCKSINILSLSFQLIYKEANSPTRNLEWLHAQMSPYRQRLFEELLTLLVTSEEMKECRDIMSPFVRDFRILSENVGGLLPKTPATNVTTTSSQGW